MCGFVIRKADRTVLAAFAAVSASALALAVSPAAAQSAFYQVSENEIAGQPGTIIRQEPMPFRRPVLRPTGFFTDRPGLTMSPSQYPAS